MRRCNEMDIFRCRMGRTENERRNERGVGAIGAIFLLALIFFLAITVVLLMFFAASEPGASSSNPYSDTNGETQSKDSQDRIRDIDSNAERPDDADIQDLGTGYLVCVYLPGVSYPRTPALDRRVAKRLLSVRRDLDGQGIAPLSFTWGFRTTCQQTLLKSNGNLKAKPGTSPHEAGRAVDVNGILNRRDGGTIVLAFEKHGWVWLGAKDPPHFEVKGYLVGEASHWDWIRKAQDDFNNGNPKGCRGTQCGQ